jgi:hypothetical protein
VPHLVIMIAAHDQWGGLSRRCTTSVGSGAYVTGSPRTDNSSHDWRALSTSAFAVHVRDDQNLHRHASRWDARRLGRHIATGTHLLVSAHGRR